MQGAYISSASSFRLRWMAPLLASLPHFHLSSLLTRNLVVKITHSLYSQLKLRAALGGRFRIEGSLRRCSRAACSIFNVRLSWRNQGPGQVKSFFSFSLFCCGETWWRTLCPSVLEEASCEFSSFWLLNGACRLFLWKGRKVWHGDRAEKAAVVILCWRREEGWGFGGEMRPLREGTNSLWECAGYDNRKQ